MKNAFEGDWVVTALLLLGPASCTLAGRKTHVVKPTNCGIVDKAAKLVRSRATVIPMRKDIRCD